MALPGPSRYQKQAAARRRTGDITRLADQYQRNVQAITGEYEQAFAQFQQQTKEKLAPYESALERYQTETYPAYEKAAENYRAQSLAFEKKIEGYNKAVASFNTWNPVASDVNYWDFLANYLGGKEADIGLVYEWEQTREVPMVAAYGTVTKRAGPDPGEFTEKFEEKLPTAPDAPTPPEIGAFDASQFDARRGQLETEFKRELGERRSARQRAVSRGGARPLLQGRA
jgi:hypothetical protein